MKIPIPVPEGCKILVTPGQQVTMSTPFYNGSTTLKTILPIAQTLKFQPERIFIALKKVIGDRIKKGDLLAEHKALFSTRHYIANVDGILIDIDHKKGSITIELDTASEQMKLCYFTGTIETVGTNLIELRTHSQSAAELVESAEVACGGKVYYLTHLSQFSDDLVENHMVVAPNLDPLTAIKLSAFGAKCVITNTRVAASSGANTCIITHPDEFAHIVASCHPYAVVPTHSPHIYFYS